MNFIHIASILISSLFYNVEWTIGAGGGSSSSDFEVDVNSFEKLNYIMNYFLSKVLDKSISSISRDTFMN